MSKRQLEELRKELFNNWVKQLEEIENGVQAQSKASMVDPETIEEISELLRKISHYIQNLNSAFYMALQSQEEFYQNYNSVYSLIETLKNTIRDIGNQEPDSPLLEEYQKKIDENKDLLEVLTWVKEILGLPRSKKRIKAWKKADRGVINKPFYPFLHLQKMVIETKDYIEENL